MEERKRKESFIQTLAGGVGYTAIHLCAPKTLDIGHKWMRWESLHILRWNSRNGRIHTIYGVSAR